jgi:pSer/pThr/pTyr-binding forkhead associated (FHA) protein
MGMRLVVRSREALAGSEASYEFDQARVVIGRGPGADVRLPHPSVSQVHALIRQEGVGYVLVDDGSTNGTLVNGKAVVPGRPRRLRGGDRIGIGAFEATFEAGVAVADATSAEGTAALARRFVRVLWSATEPLPAARLTVVSGPDEGRVLELPPSVAHMTVGRGEECDLVLSDRDVSREHVTIALDALGARVLDRDSKNGVRVNGRAVTDRRLKDGDQIQIGNTLLELEEPADACLARIEQEADVVLPPPPSSPGPGDPLEMQGAPSGPPAPTQGRRPARATLGTDLAIYLLAGSVFAASVAGLILLLRG